ncbi:Acylamidase [Pirellulimonas nuda]|uniref:Acylamidase n=1 Tax=Pirellulimonas nuda TaxID=2528009 RepID=A0A518DI83_9BACT|nr:amidase family protein [Pirellulimonas nuda]QDU91174.1 Acylamidase [Pirellulimonas nuda]
MTPSTHSEPITELGAAALAAEIASGRLTSVEATRACIERCKQQSRLNALVQPCFDAALRDAQRADAAVAAGEPLGLLHGVPVTVKDCFAMRGTEVTLGIPGFSNGPAETDSPLVTRLRGAGAVLLGKTNVPQGMLLHECNNPVFGRTLHPTDPSRSPGGSTGGEASIVASGGSPLGLGSDLGGSIRQPVHACGVAGFKPTPRRLSLVGSSRAIPGMRAMRISPGPIARHVDDLELAMRVLVDHTDSPRQPDEEAAPWRDPSTIDVSELRIAYWTDDSFLPTAPAVRRAVEEAAAALRDAGADVRKITPPDDREMMRVYVGLLSADGMRSLARLVRGGEVDPQIRRQLRIGGLARWARVMLGGALRLLGRRLLPDLLHWSGARSADDYWRLCCDADRYREAFWPLAAEQFDGRPVDAILLPPFGVTAMPHGRALDVLPASSHCFYANLVDAPAGVVPWTTVRDDEQEFPRAPWGLAQWAARAATSGSAGLPVGVQVMAPAWRDDTALAVMKRLEQLRSTPD